MSAASWRVLMPESVFCSAFRIAACKLGALKSDFNLPASCVGLSICGHFLRHRHRLLKRSPLHQTIKELE
jgi:hypothetical protein